MKKSIKVAGAVIWNSRGEILCALRSPTMKMANYWEFPGGKIEKGESPEETLIREIKEELNCSIEVKGFITEEVYEDDLVIIHLLTYNAAIISGIPEPKEHSELRWVTPQALNNFTWAPADMPTVNILSKAVLKK